MKYCVKCKKVCLVKAETSSLTSERTLNINLLYLQTHVEAGNTTADLWHAAGED